MSSDHTLPPVTDEHRRMAFHIVRRPDWPDYEHAITDPLRARLIECRAHALRTQLWRASQQPSCQTVRRVRIDAQGHAQWRTQTVIEPPHTPQQPSLLDH